MRNIMKTTFKSILACAALAVATLSFGPTVLAQTRNAMIKAAKDAVDGAVKFDKTVTPEPDENGVYTISLEAYVTGSVTVTTSTAPADIILVLDYSSSMNKDVNGNSASGANQRINILRSSVKDFVDIVKNSNGDVTADDLGKHRIAFVLYGGGDVFTKTGLSLNTFLDVDKLTTTAASTSGNSYTAAKVTYEDDTDTGGLLSLDTQKGNTNSDTAMEEAKTILSGVNYTNTPNRTRVVVFFTDGAPGSGDKETGWQNTADRLQAANDCISFANDIKTSTTYGATVYSVGMFPAKSSADATTTYLRYTSSDETGKTAMPSSSSDYVNVSGDKSIIVSSAGQLSNVFSSIASSSGGSYSAASQSSVVVDVVASSFTVSTDADLGKAKVYQVACTQASADAIISWSSTKEDITENVTLVVDDQTGEVSVTGFDYGANWCGWDASANNNTGAPHGYKLVLEIPITINDDAVGGPAVDTNADGSQLIIKDSDGKVIQSYDFISPVLKIPVNIWIQKTGLVEDDSAVFTLRRTPFVGSDVDYSTATYAKDWGTKVVVNKETMGENGLVKVSGLDPNYVYKIEEDAWGSFGYTYQDGGVQYTVGDNVQNPFKFKNIPKNVVFDEAVVRNVFQEKTAETK